MNLDEIGRRMKDAIDLLESEADALRRDSKIRSRDPLAAQAISAAAGLLGADCRALMDEVRHLRAATGCADPDRREGHCCGIDDAEVSRVSGGDHNQADETREGCANYIEGNCIQWGTSTPCDYCRGEVSS